MDALAARLRDLVDRLCAAGSHRFPGSSGNRAATEIVGEELEQLGAAVERIGFDVVGWEHGAASVSVGERAFAAHVGPFSAALDASAPLVVVATEAELAQAAQGAVLLVREDLATHQLVPRGYPWYDDPDDACVLALLERAAPVAVIAATSKYPPTTGALSPFPMIEDPDVAFPSAYLDEETGRALAALAGQVARVTLDSRRFPARGEQLVGRFGAGRQRVLITAHLDTKVDTPGAIDNAAGVAILLGAAALLAERPPGVVIELVPFNGEDHAASPGEAAYLSAHRFLEDIALVVNIDAAGSPGGPTLVSRYNLPVALDTALDQLLGDHAGLAPGPPWWASDHTLFAMRGVPSLALTSHDFARLCEQVTHTAADVPALVAASVLAEAARFVAAVIRAVAGKRVG
jgi:aminopeptidase YwaD